VALHFADFVDKLGVDGSRRLDQFLVDQRNETTRLDAITSHRNERLNPNMREDDTTPTQPNRLEPDPLTVLPKFQSQETSQTKIAMVSRNPL
jgi:hypothetical protein